MCVELDDLFVPPVCLWSSLATGEERRVLATVDHLKTSNRAEVSSGVAVKWGVWRDGGREVEGDCSGGWLILAWERRSHIFDLDEDLFVPCVWVQGAWAGGHPYLA